VKQLTESVRRYGPYLQADLLEELIGIQDFTYSAVIDYDEGGFGEIRRDRVMRLDELRNLAREAWQRKWWRPFWRRRGFQWRQLLPYATIALAFPFLFLGVAGISSSEPGSFRAIGAGASMLAAVALVVCTIVLVIRAEGQS
jgi:hypothetical protein